MRNEQLFNEATDKNDYQMNRTSCKIIIIVRQLRRKKVFISRKKQGVTFLVVKSS